MLNIHSHFLLNSFQFKNNIFTENVLRKKKKVNLRKLTHVANNSQV